MFRPKTHIPLTPRSDRRHRDILVALCLDRRHRHSSSAPPQTEDKEIILPHHVQTEDTHIPLTPRPDRRHRDILVALCLDQRHIDIPLLHRARPQTKTHSPRTMFRTKTDIPLLHNAQTGHTDNPLTPRPDRRYRDIPILYHVHTGSEAKRLPVQ